MSGNGISWAICKSAPRSRQITTPAPHHSVFCRPDALPAAQPTASKHCLVKRGKMGVNSLPKTVTRQHRGCHLNPDPTAPESSMGYLYLFSTSIKYRVRQTVPSINNRCREEMLASWPAAAFFCSASRNTSSRSFLCSSVSGLTSSWYHAGSADWISDKPQANVHLGLHWLRHDSSHGR